MDDMLRQRIRNDYHRLSRLIVEGRDILASLAVILESLERESNGKADRDRTSGGDDGDRGHYPGGGGYLGYPYRVNR